MKGLLFGFGFLSVCTVQAQPAHYPYTITTTVGMVTDIVRVVAGEQARVKGIIGEGVDPHLYKPTRGDVIALQRADVVFYCGLKLEGKMADVLERLAERKPVFAVTDGVLVQEGYVMDKGEHHDPHVWMDVGAWMRAVEAVADDLEDYDPPNAERYHGRAKAYLEELQALDTYARKCIGTIPEHQRVLVTAHDAFNYMGRAYGLEVRGIQGISTESEAGVRDIEELIDFLVERKIPAVFVESSVSDKNVRALLEGARAQGHELHIGGELFSDAMGRPGTYEGTYIGMLDHNITIIVHALGGEAPAKGLNSRLSL